MKSFTPLFSFRSEIFSELMISVIVSLLFYVIIDLYSFIDEIKETHYTEINNNLIKHNT